MHAKKSGRMPLARSSARSQASGRSCSAAMRPTSAPGSEERMNYSISHIDGLDADSIKTLRSIGLRTTARFLEAAKDAKGRKHLSEKTGIECPRLLEIANACDHLRIKGMGKGYFVLLREAGVSTVRELQYRNPATLAKR